MKFKNAGLVKSLSILIMFTVLLQCFPTATLAFDLNDIKDSVRSFVEKRDTSINTIKNTVNKYFTFTSTITSKFVKGGFSTLESKTGLKSENNKLYNAVKKKSLEKTGFTLGGGKALKDTGLWATDLAAKILTLPIGIADLGYKVKDNPQKYKDSLTNGAKALAGVILNPLPFAKGVYQNYVTAQNKAKQDPLEWGKLQGEYVTYGALAVLPAGNLKVSSKLKNVLRTAKTSVSTKASTSALDKIGAMLKHPTINLQAPALAGIGQKIAGIGAKASVIVDKVKSLALDSYLSLPSLPQINLGLATPAPMGIGTGALAGSKLRNTVLTVSTAPLSTTKNIALGNAYAALQKANRLPRTYKVGDILDGIEITAKEGNVLTWGKDRLYEVSIVRPSENVYAPIKYAKLTEKNGLLYDEAGELAHNAYIFAIDRNDNLLMSKIGKNKFHSQLTKGEPAKWAGEVVIEKGKVALINNYSGHFLPDPIDFLKVLPTLKKYLPGVSGKIFDMYEKA